MVGKEADAYSPVMAVATAIIAVGIAVTVSLGAEKKGRQFHLVAPLVRMLLSLQMTWKLERLRRQGIKLPGRRKSLVVSMWRIASFPGAVATHPPPKRVRNEFKREGGDRSFELFDALCLKFF